MTAADDSTMAGVMPDTRRVWSVRRAVPDDVDEVIRLRVLTWGSPGMAGPWDRWAYERIIGWLDAPLDEASAMVFVIDGVEPNTLGAMAIGLIDERLPSHFNISGRSGYILCVSTDEHYRNRGYATALLDSMLDWYAARGIYHVELHATPEAQHLYRRLGFADSQSGALALHKGMRRSPVAST